MERQNVSQEKMHYDSLISLFKYVIGSFTLLAGIVVFMIGNSLTEIKKNINDEVKESTEKLKNVKDDADKAIAKTKADSKEVLDYTRDLTQMQISLLKEDAKNLALSAARNKVEEAFKYQDLQRLIETTAKKEVDTQLKSLVKEEAEKMAETYELFALIQSTNERLRNNDIKALFTLDSLYRFSHIEPVKALSHDLLLQKGEIYYERYIYYSNRTPFYSPFRPSPMGPRTYMPKEEAIRQVNISPETNDSDIVRICVKAIKNRVDTNMGVLAGRYYLINIITNSSVKAFDSKAIHEQFSGY